MFEVSPAWRLNNKHEVLLVVLEGRLGLRYCTPSRLECN